MKTLKDFATACVALDNNGIYELFEFDASSALRDEIYKLASLDSMEPARESLNKLGYMFSVKSLIEY